MNAEEKLRKLNICGVPRSIQQDWVEDVKSDAVQAERERIVKTFTELIQEPYVKKLISEGNALILSRPDGGIQISHKDNTKIDYD